MGATACAIQPSLRFTTNLKLTFTAQRDTRYDDTAKYDSDEGVRRARVHYSRGVKCKKCVRPRADRDRGRGGDVPAGPGQGRGGRGEGVVSNSNSQYHGRRPLRLSLSFPPTPFGLGSGKGEGEGEGKRRKEPLGPVVGEGLFSGSPLALIGRVNIYICIWSIYVLPIVGGGQRKGGPPWNALDLSLL